MKTLKFIIIETARLLTISAVIGMWLLILWALVGR
jgi:hypothetical protein